MKLPYMVQLICWILLIQNTVTISHAQTQNQFYFTVGGEVENPVQLTMDDVKAMPSKRVAVQDMSGNDQVYVGVDLADILNLAGVSLGKQLRGENLSKYILIEAHDGYRVIFALPETDPEFTDQTILLAYLVDDKPLPEGVGPFRLVVPHEKRHARWIREISSIKILTSKE